MNEFDYSPFNRDVIRKAAKMAGVVNVSYKTRDENIAAMKALGVEEIFVYPTGHVGVIFSEQATEAVREAQDKSSEALVGLAAEILDESVPRATPEPEAGIDPAWLDDEAYERAVDDSAPSHGDLAADADDGPPNEWPTQWDQEPERFYHLVVDQHGKSTVTFPSGDDLRSVTSEHPAYLRVLESLLVGGDPESYLDEAVALATIVEHLGGRLEIRYTKPVVGDSLHDEASTEPEVLFDGEPIHGRMVDTLIRFHVEDRDAAGVVKFLERCQANPVDGAAQQLMDWGGSEQMTITPEGMLVGWKSFYRNNDGETFRPTTNGPGYVNGESVMDSEHGWRVKVGDVVTIDPDIVRPGPECGVGLHVGSHSYSIPFSGNVKCLVEVDPANVVNVPADQTGKMRVVEYKVLEIAEGSVGVEYASRHEAEVEHQVDVEKIEMTLADAQVPKGWFRRLLARKGK